MFFALHLADSRSFTLEDHAAERDADCWTVRWPADFPRLDFTEERYAIDLLIEPLPRGSSRVSAEILPFKETVGSGRMEAASNIDLSLFDCFALRLFFTVRQGKATLEGPGNQDGATVAVRNRQPLVRTSTQVVKNRLRESCAFAALFPRCLKRLGVSLGCIRACPQPMRNDRMASISKAAPSRADSKLHTVPLLCAAIVTMALSGCNSITDSNVKSASVTTQASHAFTAQVIKPKSKIATVSRRATVAKSTQNISDNVRFYGRAPHICSPSGFGQTSHCFLRT